MAMLYKSTKKPVVINLTRLLNLEKCKQRNNPQTPVREATN